MQYRDKLYRCNLPDRKSALTMGYTIGEKCFIMGPRYDIDLIIDTFCPTADVIEGMLLISDPSEIALIQLVVEIVE